MFTIIFDVNGVLDDTVPDGTSVSTPLRPGISYGRGVVQLL